jgi:N-acetylglucosaminyldiphosphoundecaprenol N-acetyl-beta-D-mannosaminyltransferase
MLDKHKNQIKVLDVSIDVTTYERVESRIIKWISIRESRYVCAANVHTLMEAVDSISFKNIINDADLVTPDGMPLVWMMRKKGYPDQQRVYGPQLMLRLVEEASIQGVPVGIYGGTEEVVELLCQKLIERYPKLIIAYAHSPPFRPLSIEEDKAIVDKINSKGVKLLFVGLGCPKQEKWIAAHKGKIQAVMVGVGAAFDFHAGVKPQAPPWMQSAGLEWLFRLFVEPRRLWRRYIYNNPRFIILATIDLIRYKLALNNKMPT